MATNAVDKYFKVATARYTLYTSFVRRLQMFFAAVLEQSDTMHMKATAPRRPLAARFASRRSMRILRPIISPCYASPDIATYIPRIAEWQAAVHDERFTGDAGSQGYLHRHVAEFWFNLQVTPAPWKQTLHHRDCVSWLELPVAFETRYNIAVEAHGSFCCSMDLLWTVKKIIRAFKRVSIKVWSLLFAADAVDTHLGVVGERGIRLSPLGIATSTASITCLPAWDADTRRRVLSGTLAHA